MPVYEGFDRGKGVIELETPDVSALLAEDAQLEAMGTPERMGISLPVNISPWSGGTSTILPDGRKLWTINIIVRGAQGLGLYFSKYKLPEGALLFIYSSDRKHIIGAFTNHNNRPDGLFATEIVKGESIVIEYSAPVASSGIVPFTINEVLYVYRPVYFPGDRSGGEIKSGNCEVNVACSEGNNWRNQAKSVVRIQIKNGNSSFWCTGSIMNNSAGDFSPLVLTADHCAVVGATYADAADLARWVFYFLYETEGCDNETVEAGKSLTGAVKLASSSAMGNDGSDFYLVLLNDQIPASYEPFYAGWSRTGELSPSGTGIHHPGGDVKKISTYLSPLTLSQWGSVDGTHFRVVWAATANGHGVTEGGSSGSPIYDNQGRLIGQLTGGESDCIDVTRPDYYGKFAFSWESNGAEDSTQLKPWLDPMNTGLTTINGVFNANMAVARFKADTTVILVGTSLNFTDLSIGNPETWKWYFEGGDPESSSEPNPTGVVYKKTGVFNVKLKVANMLGSDSLVREDYIRVVPRIYPNPTQGTFFVMMGDDAAAETSLTITNTSGQVVYYENLGLSGQQSYRIDPAGLHTGVYFITIRNLKFTETAKLFLISN